MSCCGRSVLQSEAPPLPWWLAVGTDQAEIGALIAAELRPVLEDRRLPAC